MQYCKSNYRSSGTVSKLDGLFSGAASILGWRSKEPLVHNINLATIRDLAIAQCSGIMFDYVPLLFKVVRLSEISRNSSTKNHIPCPGQKSHCAVTSKLPDAALLFQERPGFQLGHLLPHQPRARLFQLRTRPLKKTVLGMLGPWWALLD